MKRFYYILLFASLLISCNNITKQQPRVETSEETEQPVMETAEEQTEKREKILNAELEAFGADRAKEWIKTNYANGVIDNMSIRTMLEDTEGLRYYTLWQISDGYSPEDGYCVVLISATA